MNKEYGYRAWQKNFERHVNKGEKAIRILAPVPYKILVEEGIFPYEMDLKFLTPKNPGHRFLPCYSEEEIKQILESVGRDTPVGKRNYAILLLGISTGIRARDIEMLKLADIDWNKQEL